MPGSTRLIGILALLVVVGLASSARATIFSFSNPAPIVIPTSGPAVPYPSTIVVSGLLPSTFDVNVTLLGITHNSVNDIAALLVGPSGQKTYLFDGPDATVASNLTWTFDDAAASALNCTTPFTPISGTFRVNACFPASDVFPPPAPPAPYATSLGIFNGLNPNGTWSLYVFDFTSVFGGGSIANGWSLSIAVPEPSSVALLGLGLILLLRRFRSAAA